MASKTHVKAEQLGSIVNQLVEIAGIQQYKIILRDSKSQPPDEQKYKGISDVEKTLADMFVYGREAYLTVYPEYWSRKRDQRIATLCHELGHVAVATYVSVATRLAGSKSDALTPLEEELADSFGRLIRQQAEAKGVFDSPLFQS